MSSTSNNRIERESATEKRERDRRPGRSRRTSGGQALIPCGVFLSESPEETRQLGVQIGKNLPVPSVVLLRGPLGSGKTTLTRGLAIGLGVRDERQVNSPSYTLVNIYEGRCPIYHVDLYRLSGDRDIRSVGLDDFIGREGVTIVEWSERLNKYELCALEVELENAGSDRRKLRIRNRGTPGTGVRKGKP